MEEKVKPVKRGKQRRENRMAAVQFLYQWELNKPDQLNDALRVFITSQDQERDYYAFAEELVQGTIDHIELSTKRSMLTRPTGLLSVLQKSTSQCCDSQSMSSSNAATFRPL